ncbi:MAG: helix-turn-helix transcriptional regulator [Clostridiales bacterium]|nr:helix-turn-helix transcriptional regulator [Clostridiales bacterium]
MYNFEEMGKKIRAAREIKNLSRERLAELCNTSDKCISNIELGLSNPRIHTIVKICYILDLDLKDFMDFYQEDPHEETTLPLHTTEPVSDRHWSVCFLWDHTEK